MFALGAAVPLVAGDTRRPPGPPPPLLPKPGKDNLRLQRLLRKAARKKMAGAAPAPPGAFRASLSPVSEASHDVEALGPAEVPGVVAPPLLSPHTPVVHHVPSPLQKATLTSSLPQQRALCTRFQALALGPVRGPDGFASVPAPKATGTHATQFHIQLASPPQAGARGLDGGPAGQGGDTAPGPLGARPRIPVAHVRPLSSGAAPAGTPGPGESPAARQPPGFPTSEPREAVARVAVPVGPTCRSPGPSPFSLAPGNPETECLEELTPASGPPGALLPDPPSGPHPCPLPRVAPEPGLSGGLSGWTRLKKQLMEEPEQSPEPSQPERAALLGLAGPGPPASRASRMWDAVLYRMSVAESPSLVAGPGAGDRSVAGPGRLPFLYRPRFNARKLQEAARPPPARPSILERVPRPKNFNRTAAGWRLQ
ncbi:proline-rich protein 33 [Thomomys bottae]